MYVALPLCTLPACLACLRLFHSHLLPLTHTQHRHTHTHIHHSWLLTLARQCNTAHPLTSFTPPPIFFLGGRGEDSCSLFTTFIILSTTVHWNLCYKHPRLLSPNGLPLGVEQKSERDKGPAWWTEWLKQICANESETRTDLCIHCTSGARRHLHRQMLKWFIHKPVCGHLFS